MNCTIKLLLMNDYNDASKYALYILSGAVLILCYFIFLLHKMGGINYRFCPIAFFLNELQIKKESMVDYIKANDQWWQNLKWSGSVTTKCSSNTVHCLEKGSVLLVLIKFVFMIFLSDAYLPLNQNANIRIEQQWAGTLSGVHCYSMLLPWVVQHMKFLERIKIKIWKECKWRYK